MHNTLPLVQTTSWINPIRIIATSTFKAKFNIIPSSRTQDYHVIFCLSFFGDYRVSNAVHFPLLENANDIF